MPNPDAADREAAELLPCVCSTGYGDDSDSPIHFADCPGKTRPAVAQALRARDERIAAMAAVCDGIREIMATYRKQEARGGVDTPGGLEHMGDVWRLLSKWDAVRVTLSANTRPQPVGGV